MPTDPVCAGGPYAPAPPMAPPPMPVAPEAPADPGMGMAGGMPGHI